MTDQADQVQGMDDGMEDFAALVAQFDHAEVRDGEIVQGTILKIEKDWVLVDIGYKSEGQVPLHEFLDLEGKLTVKVGDKTLMDTLVPARDAYLAAQATGADFSAALSAMISAAEAGWKSTKDLQARIGRSARLGERSIGVLDAGATSCFLILRTMGNSLKLN